MLLLSKFKISGHSMEPQFKNGDKVLASFIPFLFQSPKINDIVIFEYKNKAFVKRIKKITGKKYFVQGDNRNDSKDSRIFGEILKDQILGKFIFKL